MRSAPQGRSISSSGSLRAECARRNRPKCECSVLQLNPAVGPTSWYGGKPIRSRPKRSATEEPRVLAWGRVHIVRGAVPVIEAEARRLKRRPSALIETSSRYRREESGQAVRY